ncbi:MAG: hypothetical protein ACOWWR_03890 [Eubacteriales bacterium]
MIIKKYIVTDMREAMVRARYELGKDAVIISERKIKEGTWFNPFKKAKLEVTVAIENDIMSPPLENSNKAKEAYKEQIDVKKKEETIETIQPLPIYERLNEYCKNNYEHKEEMTLDELKNFIYKNIPNNCFDEDLEFSKINALLGPTGVGKTTTIAKIASKEYLANKKKVGLITMDTYRIGAVEQLKTYAGILGIPCEVVEKPGDMKKKIDKLSYCDLLLIDTVGTSHNNKEKLDHLHMFFKDITEKINKYLVLSIATDKDTTKSILGSYDKLSYDALVLTKFDEVNTFSNLWSIIENNIKPIQYFCFGQDVPEDIQFASLDNVLSYLWGVWNERSSD